MAGFGRWSVALVAAAAASVWIGLDHLAVRLAGPPGFDVVYRDEQGATLARRSAPYLLAPDVLDGPRPGGVLEARAAFLSRSTGDYAFTLGSAGASSLMLDGAVLVRPRLERSQTVTRRLDAGLHSLAVSVRPGGRESGFALGIRLPGEPWRGRLIGPGDVVALSLADAQERLGSRAPLWLALLGWMPAATVALLLGLALLAVGPRRVLGWVDELASDEGGRRLCAALAFVAIVLPSLASLAQPGYYACHEEESYIVRLEQYQKALAGGVPMGRWFPDPVLGRGYPFLCLYAPLLYLIARPLLALGVTPLVFLKVLSAAAVTAGAWAIYRLIRRGVSSSAALLGTAVYVYAPYLHTDLFVRADIAETLGFAAFPLALLALDRVLDPRPTGLGRFASESLRDVGVLALALGALGTSHNIIAYFSIYFLALWMAVRWLGGELDRAGFRRALAGGVLGFLLTIFYAIPALVDSRRVWIEGITHGYYSYKRNFIPVGHYLFSSVRNNFMRLHLGWPAAVLLMLGLAALMVQRRRGGKFLRPLLIAESVVGCGCAFLLATRLGRAFYLVVPLAKFVEFPWRMLLFSACLAPLSAAALDLLVARPWVRRAVGMGGAAVVVLLALPTSGAPAPLLRHHVSSENFLLSNPIDYVTSMNEYLPRTVQTDVPFFGLVARPRGAAGAEILSQSRSPGRYRAEVRAGQPAVIEFNAHWFPGWRATVDGRAVRIGPRGDAPMDQGGLIHVPVPAGVHQVEISYGRTPLRWVCDLISLAALALALALVSIGFFRSWTIHEMGSKLAR